jgi:adenine-specific DNA-methyltransferase
MKLNEKYNPESFVHFVQGFLPEDLSLREEDIVINKDRYKEITKAKILGFCESLDLHVLEMDHTHDKDPRVAIATDAFKILADHWIHRALVVFKNKDSDNYRFSYLTITLDLNDKNRVIKKYSNARRYSFYLGSSAKVRTPEQQLIKKGKVKDVEDLFNRFSVEVVNKQFYLEVAKLFDGLVSIEDQNLILPGVSEKDMNTRKSFAVRLIGRAMFCWFLKQKKSYNGQLIPDEILSSKVVTHQYYHNVLEPLFFGVLNTSIDARDIRTELFDKVPYLNGGLFNPQTDDYYVLDSSTFVSKYTNSLKISDEWFKEFFELLETYNFTIDENTVFDQELSVDPEMLGRIFENLLAEINPETGSSERKRTGSFYTPRQIVEYMVDQSLVEYFKTKTNIGEKKLNALLSYDLTDDAEYPLEQKEKEQIIDAIESLKILDPACGSGAYPIGALQKIVYILQQVDPECTLWLEKKLQGVPDLYKQKIINEVKQYPFDYTRKLDVIKNSIFGVDIQPIAVDVSRLRCFLTLVVESQIDDRKSNRGIEPLPNLDFKFVCANTLIPLPKSNDTNLFDDHTGITELSKIMSDYFSCNSQRKNELKIRFTNAQKEILEKTVAAFGKSTGDLTLKLTTWNPFNNQSNSWFDPEWMFGLQEKFDVVIGNPPYIKNTRIEKSIKDQYSLHYNSAFDQWDIYVLFFEAALRLLADKGVCSLITANQWLSAKFGAKLRILLADYIVSFTDFKKYSDFDNVSVNTFVTIFIKDKTSRPLSIVVLDQNGSLNTRMVDRENIKNAVNNLGSLLSESLHIVNSIRSRNKQRFGDFYEIGHSFSIPDFYKLSELIYEGENFNPSTELKLVNTGTLSLLGLSYGVKHFKYDGKKYLKPTIKRADFKRLFPTREIQTKPKLIISSMGGLNIDIDFFGHYLGTRPTLWVNSENINKLKIAFGILNSDFIEWFYKQQYSVAGMTGFKVKYGDIKDTPYPEMKPEDESRIIELVDNIIQAKQKGSDQDFFLFKKILDELITGLYGLNESEKVIIRSL